MSKFKVGDKVRVRKDLVVNSAYGKVDDEKYTFATGMDKMRGKVATISRDDGDCYRILEAPWWWTDEMLEPIDDYKIVITSDGKITLARLYDGKKVIRTAKAKCAPDDEFSFEIGAKIAFRRLVKPVIDPTEKEPEYYTGKVVCADNADLDQIFTVGKIYTVQNGTLKYDDGDIARVGAKSIDDLNEERSVKFIELAEDAKC